MEKHGILYKSLQGAAMGASFWIALFAVWAAYASWGILTQVNTVGTGSGLSSIEWNKMVTDLGTIDSKLAAVVPTGWVMAFVGASCPAGWSPADGTPNGVKKTDGSLTTLDLRGEFIRGLDGGRNVDTSRTLWSFQDGSTKLLMNGSVDPTNPGPNPEGNSPSWVITHKPSVEMIGVQTWNWGSYTARFTLRSAMDTVWWGASETRPRNVALLYCVKN